MDITSNKEIDKQILEFLYYESITLTVNYAEEYILNKNNEGKDNKNNKIRKRIDDINIVIKLYLETEKIEFDNELLWKGKLCSLVSLVFNLTTHKEMILELNGDVKNPVSIITKAVFNEYQNHEIFSIIPNHKLKYYQTRKKEIISELGNHSMEELLNKYNNTQFLEKMVKYFNSLINEFEVPKLLFKKPSYT
ncbi:hypothetical protein H8356DRAFT_928876 [Neocallimastix lanati (nom. inval.)]|nr:hypothetical protein H8356DRAFT_928876 [Neocallimastix sp. JGI-2020a]